MPGQMNFSSAIWLLSVFSLTPVDSFTVSTYSTGYIFRRPSLPQILQRQRRDRVQTHTLSLLQTETETKNKLIPSPSNRRRQEYGIYQKDMKWLTFLYHRIREAKIGELNKQIVDQMKPAMVAWSRRKSILGAQRAEFLLRRYVDEHIAGNKAVKVLSTRVFNTVLDAWAKSGEGDAPQQVERILEWMNNDLEIKSDFYTMAIWVASWAKSGLPNSATRAEEILERMENDNADLIPNTVTYNTVLHALAISTNLKDKGKRAENIVRRMEKRYEVEGREECRPDIFTYQSLISAWSRSNGVPDAPRKAEKVLKFLREQQKEQEKIDGSDDSAKHSISSSLAPNSHCYSAVIHAWGESNESNKGRRAYNLLQEMRMSYEHTKNDMLKPNPVVYTSVINACSLTRKAFSTLSGEEKEEAYLIARLTWEEMEIFSSSYGSPNDISYASFLKVCATTLPYGIERDDVVRRVFEKCCSAGQVSSLVMNKISWAASPELYGELMDTFVLTDDDAEELSNNSRVDSSERIIELPSYWVRNVKGPNQKTYPYPTFVDNIPESRAGIKWDVSDL